MIDALGVPQTLLLLGGTSDIALAVAEEYARRGRPHVLLAARPGGRRDAAVARVQAAGLTVEPLDLEATDFGSHAGLVAGAAQHGDVDVAVVAFGLLGDEERAWQDHDLAVELAQVNYTAAVSVGVCLGDLMRTQGHGTIVALSSVAGERVRRSNFVYGSTKAGMDGFFLGLGEALREHGVGVLVVRPGFVRTKMTEGREAAPLAATPEDVARAVVEGVAARRDLVWVPRPLRVVMSGLRHVPRPLFRRLPV
jgi:decaprenylphospho-beta-D-erythro-pentofuranosid-2-ulose 2-reductase